MIGQMISHYRYCLFKRRIVLGVAVTLCLNGAFAQTSTDTDAILKVGGGVSPPAPIFSPDPEYSKEARHAKRGDICVLRLVVDTNGGTRDIKVTQSVGLGLDEKAIEAVKQWKFKPAMKDGKPVAVQIMVQIDFRFYNGPPPKSSPQATPMLASVDTTPNFTQEELSKLAAQWNTKTPYSQEQLAELRAKCASYINTKVEDLSSKQIPLPPHECSGVLAWMRNLRVESLYMSGKPPH